MAGQVEGNATTPTFGQVASPEKLRSCWEDVLAADRGDGVLGAGVTRFAQDAEAHLAELAAELEAATYAPGPLTRIELMRDDGRVRSLHVPLVRGRIAGVAVQLRDVQAERGCLTTDLATLLEARPLTEVLRSMPGLGLRTALKILIIVGDGSAFPTASHLAASAGLSPVTRRSGTSIKGETRSYRGNYALKSALFLSAFASLADPTSRAYCDRKRAEGKKHNAALTCLARRRVLVLYAMLRDGVPTETPTPTRPPPAPPRLDNTHRDTPGQLRGLN